MRLEIDKQRFKDFLVQFTDDVPYEIDLVKSLLAQMPPQVCEGLLEELYFKEVYRGSTYAVRHLTYRDDIHYFTKVEDIATFMGKVASGILRRPASVSVARIKKYMGQGKPLYGYEILKGEDIWQ